MRAITIFAGLFIVSILLASVNGAALKREDEEQVEQELDEIDDCTLGAITRFLLAIGEAFEEAEGEGINQFEHGTDRKRAMALKKRLQSVSKLARRHQKN